MTIPVSVPAFISEDQELFAFAKFMHDAHVDGVQPLRKYTGEHYSVHPLSVANILYLNGISPEVDVERDMILAALGHDLFEDTNVSRADIMLAGANSRSVQFIMECTDPKIEGNRATRHAHFNAMMRDSTAEARTVKLADCIHNLGSLPPKETNGFAYQYAREKQTFIRTLDEVVVEAANENIERVYRSLRRELLGIIDEILSDAA